MIYTCFSLSWKHHTKFLRLICNLQIANDDFVDNLLKSHKQIFSLQLDNIQIKSFVPCYTGNFQLILCWTFIASFRELFVGNLSIDICITQKFSRIRHITNSLVATEIYREQQYNLQVIKILGIGLYSAWSAITCHFVRRKSHNLFTRAMLMLVTVNSVRHRNSMSKYKSP